MTGHLLGAAGSTEAAYSVLTLMHGVMPPTINQEVPDPDCDLDYIPNQAREARLNTAMTFSFGFGGTNTVLIFARPDGRERQYPAKPPDERDLHEAPWARWRIDRSAVIQLRMPC